MPSTLVSLGKKRTAPPLGLDGVPQGLPNALPNEKKKRMKTWSKQFSRIDLDSGIRYPTRTRGTRTARLQAIGVRCARIDGATQNL